MIDRKGLLYKAIDYAITSNNEIYHRQLESLKVIESAKNVCVFGTGKFFEEGYPYIKNIVKANLVTDNDSIKWGNVFKDYHV